MNSTHLLDLGARFARVLLGTSRPLKSEGAGNAGCALHPTQPYIVFNDIPKVEALKKIFAENYIEKPTLVSNAKVTN